MLVILLQDGKGGDLVSALGGGGSQTLFGSTGATSFLTKATIVLTVIFVLTSLSLAVLKTREQRSVIGAIKPAVQKTQPVEVKKGQKKAAAPAALDKTKPAATTAPAVDAKTAPAKGEKAVTAPAATNGKPAAVKAKTVETKPADKKKKETGKK